MDFGLVNKSALVSADDAATMADAISIQLNQHVCPLWGEEACSVTSYGPKDSVPQGVFPILLLDNIQSTTELGDHDQNAARVLIQPIIDAGGAVLFGANSKTIAGLGPGTSVTVDELGVTVSSVVSHEVLETALDVKINDWCVRPSEKNTMYAKEICDPCEEIRYQILARHPNGATTSVVVSDFVLPSWFDELTDSHSTDFCNLLHSPFELSPGGYCLTLHATGDISPIYGYARVNKLTADRIIQPWSRFQKRIAG